MDRTRLAGTPEPTLQLPGAGVSLAADAWGAPDHQPVLLLHGGGQTRHAWRGAGRTLGGGGYRAIALDMRGHGDSGWSADGVYHYSTFVDDLAAVAASLGRPPILVGASLGGIVSLLATGEDGRVEPPALVLVDIAHRSEREGVQRIRAFMSARPDGFASLDEVADAIAAYQPHRSRPTNLDGLAKNVRRGEDGRYHWHWDPRYFASRRDLSTEERERRTTAAARRIAERKVPTLLVRGGLSDVLSETAAREFRDLVPHAEYVNVTEAGHMVAGDRNDVFAGAVVDFLHRVAPPS